MPNTGKWTKLDLISIRNIFGCNGSTTQKVADLACAVSLKIVSNAQFTNWNLLCYAPSFVYSRYSISTNEVSPAKKSWAVGPWWWLSWKGSNLMPKNRDKTANNYVWLTVKVKIWAYTITLTFNSEFLLRFGLLQVMNLLAIPKNLVSVGFKYERLLT